MKRAALDELPQLGVSHDPQIAKRVLLNRGDVPHLTSFSRATLTPGQTARAHRHTDMFEVFFVESGAGVMKIDGAQQQLLPGVCIVVEPGEEHEITNSGDCELVLNYFGLVP